MDLLEDLHVSLTWEIQITEFQGNVAAGETIIEKEQASALVDFLFNLRDHRNDVVVVVWSSKKELLSSFPEYSWALDHSKHVCTPL